jgi:hypothetical protein
VDAARKLRQMVVDEDADVSHVVYAAEPDDDALDHAVAPEDLWPAWQCDDCGQHWDSQRWTCGYCGVVRPDADTLA